MTKDAVDRMLSDARMNRGRLLHLQAEIARLNDEIDRAVKNLAYDAAVAHNYELSDMPRGTSVSQPTERIGLQLASGWEPDDVKAMRAELDAAMEEAEWRELDDHFVHAWLEGLPDRERWLIQNQVIDGVFWRDVLIRYRREFGTDVSKDTLQRVKARAMERIYKMAE